jgi:hypothetical protein
MTSCLTDYIEFSEMLEFLADLSLNAPDFETARKALRLQTKLQEYWYGKTEE